MASFGVVALLLSVAFLPPPVDGGRLDDQLRNPSGAILTSSSVSWDGGDLEVGLIAEAPKEEPEVVLEDDVSFDGLDLSAAARGTASGDNIEMLTRIAGMGGPLQGVTNGSMPAGLLCPIPWSPSFSLYCPVIEPLTALNEQYRQVFGSNLQFASGYRAGYAGRSFHGWGLAMDLAGPSGGTLGFGDPQYHWLLQNAPAYGWFHPFWAGTGGMNPEAWHWEFGSYYRGTVADYNSAVPPVMVHWIKH